MPKKLIMFGVLMALVLGAFGLAGRGADAQIQSFCTGPANCLALATPIDWYMCYDTSNGAGAPVSPTGPEPYTCGAGTSAAAIPVGLPATPIRIWQVIKGPAGSRLTLPITHTTYTPPAWIFASPPAGAVTGDVTARFDVLCDGGAGDILATAASGPGPSSNWPGFNWLPYSLIRQNVPPVSPDPTTASNNGYVNDVRPMPATYTNFSLDRANVTAAWLGGVIILALPQTTGDVAAPNAGWPLQNLTATSPYGTNPRVNVTLLGDPTAPPDNMYLCLQSPQDSVSMTNYTKPPTAAGWYPRWTLFTSDKDLIDGQRTRILDVQCMQVGTPASPDTDGDCLSNADEATAGTNSALADSDGDAVADGVEVAAGMDPLAANADADGANDYTEMFQYTNPAMADTDGDGSLDAQDDLAGFNCAAVAGVCIPNLGDTTADDNCPAVANPTQTNTDSQPDWTDTPKVGFPYRGDATNNHQDWQGDACDNDDDNDGMGDVLEVPNGFRILNSAPVSPSPWCKSIYYIAAATTLTTTLPLNSDTDSDGGLDGRECQFGSRPDLATSRFPAAPSGTDPDGDLLFPVAAETFYRTQRIVVPGGTLQDDLEQPGSCVLPIPDTKIGPSDVDSDGDCLNDGVEVKWYATDPSNFDTDTDGCSDGREAADVNGDHKVNAAGDGLGVGMHILPPPVPPYNVGGVRRADLATYDINKDGIINTAMDGFLVGKLKGNCLAGIGAQINSKPIINLSK